MDGVSVGPRAEAPKGARAPGKGWAHLAPAESISGERNERRGLSTIFEAGAGGEQAGGDAAAGADPQRMRAWRFVGALPLCIAERPGRKSRKGGLQRGFWVWSEELAAR